MPQKNGQAVDTHGVLTALRAAVQEERGLSPGTLLLEQPSASSAVRPCRGYPDHVPRTREGLSL